ncbi:MAG TPA: hypothetical protein VFD07_13830 [Candidatus Krumholzibacteria bacterium]|jgi:hypothetical protein|nr:hypothetical protein [Candidatus Krumholzibacteria bacterium]
MNCRIAKKQMLELDASPASDTLSAALRLHLECCDGCARLQRQARLAASWLHDLPDAEPSANFEWRLKLRLSQLERDPATVPLLSPRRSWALPFVLSTAAAATLVLVFGWSMANRSSVPETPLVEAQSNPPLVARWSPAPAERGSVSWPRLVPVRAGVPLGPKVGMDPEPSILGAAASDTSIETKRPRPEAIETQPVRW